MYKVEEPASNWLLWTNNKIFMFWLSKWSYPETRLKKFEVATPLHWVVETPLWMLWIIAYFVKLNQHPYNPRKSTVSS